MTETSEPTKPAPRRALDPMHRLSEVLFGLIMVLTFTGTFRVASGDIDVTTMLLAALGCGIAWGLIDGVMFLFCPRCTNAARTCSGQRPCATPERPRRRMK